MFFAQPLPPDALEYIYVGNDPYVGYHMYREASYKGSGFYHTDCEKPSAVSHGLRKTVWIEAFFCVPEAPLPRPKEVAGPSSQSV